MLPCRAGPVAIALTAYVRRRLPRGSAPAADRRDAEAGAHRHRRDAPLLAQPRSAGLNFRSRESASADTRPPNPWRARFAVAGVAIPRWGALGRQSLSDDPVLLPQVGCRALARPPEGVLTKRTGTPDGGGLSEGGADWRATRPCSAAPPAPRRPPPARVRAKEAPRRRRPGSNRTARRDDRDLGAPARGSWPAMSW